VGCFTLHHLIDNLYFSFNSFETSIVTKLLEIEVDNI